MTNTQQTNAQVLNKHTLRGASGVYIGRGTKWGNPFKIGEHGDRAAVITKHEQWLRDQHHLLRDLHELRGKNVICFCAPQGCHGDLLIRLANGTREELIRWWRCEAA